MTSESTKQQAAPERRGSPAVWPLVIADLDALEAPAWLRDALKDDMRARDNFGHMKYGTPLEVDNGRDATADAYQEALDLCAYTRQQAERTGRVFWDRLAGQAVGIAAAIRFQIALDESTRKDGV